MNGLLHTVSFDAPVTLATAMRISDSSGACAGLVSNNKQSLSLAQVQPQRSPHRVSFHQAQAGQSSRSCSWNASVKRPSSEGISLQARTRASVMQHKFNEPQ